MFRRIQYPIKNIWRNDKIYKGTAFTPFRIENAKRQRYFGHFNAQRCNPGDNEPDNNNLFVTILMCICVYSINKNK